MTGKPIKDKTGDMDKWTEIGEELELLPLIIFLVELGVTTPSKLMDFARRITRAYKKIVEIGIRDDITRTIISVLSTKDKIHIAELEREVRRLRGTASRRIIYMRLRLLEDAGVIRTYREGNRRYVEIREYQ
ncbi:MAG: winged helix-turn-helix domain-containing protein [Desulfurococcales archaeon]|nr:winged helix-turn-helix domain-containing protein [Desulfurococcales archaeon]MEB3846042.1 winged helix-turn-helix domain-containing protein [Desulfurococcales archaeon]